MRRRQLLDHSTPEWEAMDLTAMLDVLFILLVFLMLSLGGVYISMPLTLPQVNATPVAPQQGGQVILLEQSGSFLFAGKRYNQVQTLAKSLPQSSPGTWKIAAEDQAPAGKLVELLHQLNQRGITQLEILAQEQP